MATARASTEARDKMCQHMEKIENGAPLTRDEALALSVAAQVCRRGDRPPEEVVAEVVQGRARLPVNRKDVALLRGCRKLNDEVINHCMLRLAAGCQSTLVASTHFYSKLTSTKNQQWENVARWFKDEDILSQELVVIPIHLRQKGHWVLCVAKPRKRKLFYYDSLNRKFETALKVARPIEQWLTQRDADADADERGWVLYVHKHGTFARQRNDYDCGLFVLYTAFCVLHKREIAYVQEDVPLIRKRLEFAVRFGPKVVFASRQH